jgi:hypothetical protein
MFVCAIAAQVLAAHHFATRYQRYLEQILNDGAGGGNRTLVFSLEVAGFSMFSRAILTFPAISTL